MPDRKLLQASKQHFDILKTQEYYDPESEGLNDKEWVKGIYEVASYRKGRVDLYPEDYENPKESLLDLQEDQDFVSCIGTILDDLNVDSLNDVKLNDWKALDLPPRCNVLKKIANYTAF